MLLVADLLNHKGRDVWSVSPEATVYEAIEMMAEKGAGAMVVMEGGQAVGVISERDYTRKVELKGRSSREVQVREIMSQPVICARLDDTIEHTMSLMTEHRVRHLPVMAEEKIVGVVSIGDVVRGVIEDKEYHIQQLTKYIASS